MIGRRATGEAARSEAQRPMVNQPNEFDLRRIERRLEERVRYRYVVPTILGVEGGYRIESPCCSRTVDPDGGIIDVALLLFDQDRGQWRLYNKDHSRKSWEIHSIHKRLTDLLDELAADPRREFWQ